MIEELIVEESGMRLDAYISTNLEDISDMWIRPSYLSFINM